MPPGHVQGRFTELLPAPKDTKDRREVLQRHIPPLIIRVLCEPEGDRARIIGAKTRGIRIIGAVQNGTSRLVEQLPVDRFNRGQVRIEIEMLFLNVQDERVLGMKK